MRPQLAACGPEREWPDPAAILEVGGTVETLCSVRALPALTRCGLRTFPGHGALYVRRWE